MAKNLDISNPESRSVDGMEFERNLPSLPEKILDEN